MTFIFNFQNFITQYKCSRAYMKPVAQPEEGPRRPIQAPLQAVTKSYPRQLTMSVTTISFLTISSFYTFLSVSTLTPPFTLNSCSCHHLQVSLHIYERYPENKFLFPGKKALNLFPKFIHKFFQHIPSITFQHSCHHCLSTFCSRLPDDVYLCRRRLPSAI